MRRTTSVLLCPSGANGGKERKGAFASSASTAEIDRLAKESRFLLEAAAAARKKAESFGIHPQVVEEDSMLSSVEDSERGLGPSQSSLDEGLESKRAQLYRHLAQTLATQNAASGQTSRRRPRLSLGVNQGNSQFLESSTSFGLNTSSRRRSCASLAPSRESRVSEEALGASEKTDISSGVYPGDPSLWADALLKRRLRIQERRAEIQRRLEEQREHQTLLAQLSLQRQPNAKTDLDAARTKAEVHFSSSSSSSQRTLSGQRRLAESPHVRLSSVSPRLNRTSEGLFVPFEEEEAMECDTVSEETEKRSWQQTEAFLSERTEEPAVPRCSSSSSSSFSSSMLSEAVSVEAMEAATFAVRTSSLDLRAVLKLLPLLSPLPKLGETSKFQDPRLSVTPEAPCGNESQKEMCAFSSFSIDGLFNHTALKRRSASVADKLPRPKFSCGFGCFGQEGGDDEGKRRTCVAPLANAVATGALCAASEEEAFALLRTEVLDEKFNWWRQLRSVWAQRQRDAKAMEASSLSSAKTVSSSTERRFRKESEWRHCVREATSRVSQQVFQVLLANSAAAAAEAAAFPLDDLECTSTLAAAPDVTAGSLSESLNSTFGKQQERVSGRSAVWRWLWMAGRALGFCESSRFAALQLIDAYAAHPSFPFRCVCVSTHEGGRGEEGKGEGEERGVQCSVCCGSRELSLCSCAALLLAASLRCHWKDVRSDTYLKLLQNDPTGSLFSEDDVVSVQADMLELLPPSVAIGATAADYVSLGIAALRDFPSLLRHAPLAAAEKAAQTRLTRRESSSLQSSRRLFEADLKRQRTRNERTCPMKSTVQSSVSCDVKEEQWTVASVFDYWVETGLLAILHELLFRCCSCAAEGGLLQRVPASKFTSVVLLLLMREYCGAKARGEEEEEKGKGEEGERWNDGLFSSSPKDFLRLEEWERAFCLFVLKSRYEADLYFWRVLLERPVSAVLASRPQRPLVSLWRKGAMHWKRIQKAMAREVLLSECKNATPRSLAPETQDFVACDAERRLRRMRINVEEEGRSLGRTSSEKRNFFLLNRSERRSISPSIATPSSIPFLRKGGEALCNFNCQAGAGELKAKAGSGLPLASSRKQEALPLDESERTRRKHASSVAGSEAVWELSPSRGLKRHLHPPGVDNSLRRMAAEPRTVKVGAGDENAGPSNGRPLLSSSKDNSGGSKAPLRKWMQISEKRKGASPQFFPQTHRPAVSEDAGKEFFRD